VALGRGSAQGLHVRPSGESWSGDALTLSQTALDSQFCPLHSGSRPPACAQAAGCILGAKIKQRLVRLAFATSSFSACLAQIRHHHRPSEIKTGDHRRRTPDLSLVMLHGNAGLSMLGCCSTGRKSPRPCRWIQVEKVQIQEARSLGSNGTFPAACLYDGRPGAFIGSGQAIVSWQYRLLHDSLSNTIADPHYHPSNTSTMPVNDDLVSQIHRYTDETGVLGSADATTWA
jgi:hypothetical protein